MNFGKMAARREEEAAQLEDDEIWVNIISKFVLLDHPIELKIDMMLEIVGENRSIIENALQTCLDRRIVKKELIEEVMTKL